MAVGGRASFVPTEQVRSAVALSREDGTLQYRGGRFRGPHARRVRRHRSRVASRWHFHSIIGCTTSSPHCCCCASAVSPRPTAQLTIEARCASQATWNHRLHARSGRPARPAGCPRASAAGPHSASGSWRNPGYGQSRPRAALEAPARCLPHPLARSARAAHDLPSRPFVWQDFSLVATEALAPMWFA